MVEFHYSASEIAKIVDGEVQGDGNTIALRFSKIDSTDGKDSLTFLSNPGYTKFLYTTSASIILVSDTLVLNDKIKSVLIRVKDPYVAFARIVNSLKKDDIEAGIDPHSCIHDTVEISPSTYIGAFSYIGRNSSIGDNCKILPNVYIGNNVRVGNNCILYPGVKIYDDTVIGDNVIIHSGAVIGSDGFGFAVDNGKFMKIEHIGNVIIQNNVEIGANTTIDKAQFESTLIMEGVKLDNLIQVAHNVSIGANTVIAAQTGIAGSTKIGNYCRVGGQAGISGHISITDNVSIGPQSGVAKSINEAGSYMGTPAMEFIKFAKIYALLKKFLKN
ncbi:MAG: UDP-3-O-(3-hydroxymyristoyl)glucosamine N-acyltransferase [Solitalea-like symbiont of Acarus siro]